MKRDRPVLDPPKFFAYTPQPKPFLTPKTKSSSGRRALQDGEEEEETVVASSLTSAEEEASSSSMSSSMGGIGRGSFQASIDAFPYSTNACFDHVAVIDTTGGAFPTPAALATAWRTRQFDGLFVGGETDCGTSPFLGSSYGLDSCAIGNSTLVGCAGEQGYLGLEKEEAEVCAISPTGGQCRLPFDVLSSSSVRGLGTMGAAAALNDMANDGVAGGASTANPSSSSSSVQITRATVMVTCTHPAPACKNSKVVREALTTYLHLGDEAKVATSLDGLNPSVAGHLGMLTPDNEEEEEEEEEENNGSRADGCNTVVQYHVYITTKDPALAQRAKAALSAFNKPPTNDAFAAGLQAVPGFESLCAVAAAVSFDYVVPLVASGSNVVGDMTSHAITPALAVLDGEEGVKSLTSFAPGETINLKLSKFPPSSLLTLTLRDSKGKIAANVAAFEPPSENEIVSWQVPVDVPPGFYVFSAFPASNPGITAVSSIVKVGGKVGDGERRR